MSLLLLLKIVLAPALVAGASLAGRRFGARVGGWLIGFPVVAGPVLWFYARDEGAPFAAGAAAGTVLGTLSLCCFLVTYAWSATRLDWRRSVGLGWLAFVVATLILDRTAALRDWSLGLRLGAAFLALSLTLRSLPRLPGGPPAPRPRHDLALRLVATAVLVLSLTAVARLLGPSLSGLFTPFPVATTILVVFAHREGGPGGVVAVLGGFIPSLYSFACFCASLAFGLVRWPVPTAFGIALLVSLLTQGLVLVSVPGVRGPPTVPPPPQSS